MANTSHTGLGSNSGTANASPHSYLTSQLNPANPDGSNQFDTSHIIDIGSYYNTLPLDYT